MELFGSCATHLESVHSDLDLSLHTKTTTDMAPDELFKLLVQKFSDNGDFDAIRTIQYARVPLIKFRHKPRYFEQCLCVLK